MPCPPRAPVPLQIPQHIRACIQQSRAYQPQNEPRVIHDLIECCTRYPTLRARISNFRPERCAQRLVALRGTIPIVYKGAPYKIPVHIWVMAYHPLGPPHIFVVPTPTMVLRPRHPHVAQNGFVHLPYLSQWDPLTSTLQECVDAMRQAFSIKPPVYSRDTASAQPPEQQQKQNLIRTLSARLTSALQARQRAADEHMHKLHLRRSNIVAEENTNHALNQHNTKQYLPLLQHHELLATKQATLTEWLSHHPPPPPRASIDDVTHPLTVLSEQSLKAKAADAAMADALDQMDEAIDKGVVDTDTYMREVRKLARMQFFHRVMLRKIQLLLAATESHPGYHPVMPNASPRLQPVPHTAFKI